MDPVQAVPSLSDPESIIVRVMSLRKWGLRGGDNGGLRRLGRIRIRQEKKRNNSNKGKAVPVLN
jgi:hypothetical protein